MEYVLHLAILVCFYTLLAQSLNIIAGYTGLVSLAHAAFFGIGAYTTAILSVNYGWPLWVNLPLAMLTAGSVALLISVVALRTFDDYFVICTLGIQVIVEALMNNLASITRGPFGIADVPPVTVFGLSLNNKLYFFGFALCIAGIVWLALYNLSRSGFGSVLRAISEDEVYTKSAGKNVFSFKLVAFVLSCTLAAIPGVLYAHYVSYIDPTSFSLTESIFILSISIIGGMQNMFGAFLAALLMVLLPEVFYFLGISTNTAANFRQIIYGAMLILITMHKKWAMRLPKLQGKRL